MELHQRYVEFAGAKINPRGVFGVVQCQHCGHTLPASRWTNDLHRTYEALKTGYKTPVSYWKGAIVTAVGLAVGTILITGFLGFSVNRQRADWDKRETAFETAIRQPVPGVTLAVVGNNTGMAVWRVCRVSGETVWLRQYTGNRTLTNPYTETGWATLPDAAFATEAVGYAADIFAKKGLKRTTDLSNKSKPYDGMVFSLLDK